MKNAIFWYSVSKRIQFGIFVVLRKNLKIAAIEVGLGPDENDERRNTHPSYEYENK